MKFSRLACLAAAALSLAAGCSGKAGGNAGASADAIDFPMFDGAEVLSSHAWRQTISSRPGAGDAAILREGAGTYEGHDVVAGTQALMTSLEGWLNDLDAHPPAGYAVAVSGDDAESMRARARDLGVDFAVFENVQNGRRHGVAVLAVDPATLDEKTGPVLRMIGKFRLLPPSWRASIDAQAKSQTGFTVTELTDPDTPVGAAIAGLDRLREFGGRGVVIVDAVKTH